jgi:hypothetical protein
VCSAGRTSRSRQCLLAIPSMPLPFHASTARCRADRKRPQNQASTLAVRILTKGKAESPLPQARPMQVHSPADHPQHDEVEASLPPYWPRECIEECEVRAQAMEWHAVKPVCRQPHHCGYGPDNHRSNLAHPSKLAPEKVLNCQGSNDVTGTRAMHTEDEEHTGD